MCVHHNRFAVYVLGERGKVLPPTTDGLLQRSRLFHHDGTFGNYVTSVKLACELEGAPVEVFLHPSLRRAAQGIEKRRLWAPRVPTWIGMGTLDRLLAIVIERHI